MYIHTYRYTKQGLFLLFLLPFNATQAPSSSPNSLELAKSIKNWVLKNKTTTKPPLSKNVDQRN